MTNILHGLVDLDTAGIVWDIFITEDLEVRLLLRALLLQVPFTPH